MRSRRLERGAWTDWIVAAHYEELHEDTHGPKGPVIGDRNNAPEWYDRYSVNGCIYSGTDAPGFGGLKGYFRRNRDIQMILFEVSCRVLLTIVDMGTHNIVHTSVLDFDCRGILPRSQVITGAGGRSRLPQE